MNSCGACDAFEGTCGSQWLMNSVLRVYSLQVVSWGHLDTAAIQLHSPEATKWSSQKAEIHPGTGHTAPTGHLYCNDTAIMASSPSISCEADRQAPLLPGTCFSMGRLSAGSWDTPPSLLSSHIMLSSVHATKDGSNGQFVLLPI